MVAIYQAKNARSRAEEVRVSITTMKKPDGLNPRHQDQIVILIAEDDVLVANMVRIVLENEGYFTLTASDGEEALLVASEYNGHIHLLLSDIKMPKLDGFQLRERILFTRPETKILFMSGESDRISPVPCLRKPFLPRDLREIVRRTIGQSMQA